MTQPLGLPDIRDAARRLRGRLLETPCLPSRTLSAILGCEVFLKFENLQFTASFKERGALNKLAQLSDAERRAGVLAVSAGNHAQGVAYHAQQLGIPATIVMPRFAPAVKVENTRRFGAEVILEGDSFDAARAAGLALARQRGATLVHPYDDPAIVAGQGTVALEMLAQQPALDTLLVPLGGGGLIAGIAVAAKALKPGIAVVGVQSECFPGGHDLLKHTRTPRAERVTIADGIGVESPGSVTGPLIERHVDDVVLVGESAIEEAVLMLLEIEKTVVEGAGATGLAALLAHRGRFAGRQVGIVLTGGNIAPLLLAEILQRGMARSGRLARIRVNVRDVPGSLGLVAQLLGEAGANIEEVQHQRAFTSLPAASTEIDFVIQTRGREHLDEVVALLRGRGLDAHRQR